jgi:hypothetical protein
MMTKPPGFASSSTLPLDDEEESIDESLDEILLEANERPPENSAKSLEAVPSALSDDDSDADSPAPVGEVTVLAPRPTFFDEVREEETKVDPYETAIRAAASRGDGLTSQASKQRDQALRKSTSQPRLPTARANDDDDVEFEDADADDSQKYGASLSGDIGERTPAEIPLGDEDVSPPSGFLSGGGSDGFQPRLPLPPPMRTSPPPGRPDIYPGRRIPTPSSTSNTNDFLPIPTGGFGSGSHYPSIAIPAPIAVDSTSARVAALTDNRIRLPAAGLASFLVTAFGGGLLIGALLWRGHAAPAPIQQLPVAVHTAPAIITEPVTQPIVKPVPPPAPAPEVKPAAPAASTTAAAPAPAPSMPTMAAEAQPAPAVVEMPPPAPTKPAKKASSASSKPRKFSMADEDAILNGEDPTPPPPEPRAAPRAKKKKAAWTDPFAQ